MKVNVENVPSKEEEQATLRVFAITEEIQSAIDLLEEKSRSIRVLGEHENLILPANKIYYAESVDKRTYIYTKDRCYEATYRLYELDELLNTDFFRCSKSLLVNVRKIRSVKGELNGRMVAELLNGEKLMISRSYVKDLKRKLGL